MASLAFGFPLNAIVTLLLPAIVLVIFLRVHMERKISWWKSIFGPPVEWNLSKSLDELTELFKKQQRHLEKTINEDPKVNSESSSSD